jgi:hypothetical protein
LGKFERNVGTFKRKCGEFDTETVKRERKECLEREFEVGKNYHKR